MPFVSKLKRSLRTVLQTEELKRVCEERFYPHTKKATVQMCVPENGCLQ